MKRFVVVGLGRFGSAVAAKLYGLRHEVVAIDTDEAAVDRIGPQVTRAVVGDATNLATLQEMGASHADVAVICTSDLAASTLALLAVRDLGIEEVYVKVHSPQHQHIANALGATETIFPERDVAEGLASRITSRKLLRYVQYSDQFSIQEMAVPDAWQGKSLRAIRIEDRFPVQVVAVHDILTDTIALPDPDRPLRASDSLLVAGSPSALADLERLR
jgi:trk system potassium uptake protein TrkA